MSKCSFLILKSSSASSVVNKHIASLSSHLYDIIQDDNRKTREMNWMGVNIPVQFFDYQAEGKKFVIWGLTAHILTRAASVVLQRQPSFVELPRPRYTSAPIASTNESKP